MKIKEILLFVATTFFVCIASAQIKIGQTAGFTGAAADSVKETFAGAKLYLDAVNQAGGVNGKKIELISLDDKFKPKIAAENASKLIADPDIVALFLTRGTPHTQAILPLLSENKIVLIAPSTGAMALHKPVHPWLFNVRTTYQREAELLTRHVGLLGINTVAVIQVDDSFGSDAFIGVSKVVQESGRQLAAHELFDREKSDFSAIVPKIMAAKPLSIIFLGTGKAVVDGVAALRAAGSKATIATLSNNASAGFVKAMGKNAANMIVSQVFPSARTLKVALASEAVQLAHDNNIPEVTPQMLEGFAAAKVLVLALKRCGKNITRSNIKTALESFRQVDIGGMEISFSPTDHTGLNFVDLSLVTPSGIFAVESVLRKNPQ